MRWEHTDPNNVVMPLLGLTEESAQHEKGPEIEAFLGTCFCIDPHPFIITCNHVVDEWEHLFAVPDRSENKMEPLLYRVEVIDVDPRNDIALLSAPGLHPNFTIKMHDVSDLPQNQQVMTLEYSGSVARDGRLNPVTSVRIGNIVTRFMSDSPHGDSAFEVSFPGLRGASGAPILLDFGPRNFELCGIIRANVSHHLLPVHVETILDEKNEIFEETRFMLPQALCTHVKHIMELVRKNA